MVVEAVVCKSREEGACWGLRQVKGDSNWGSYMTIASTPGAAMYGRPMVYVHFVDDDAGCSSAAGALQLSIIGGSGNVEATDVNHVHEEDAHIPMLNAGPYSAVVIDFNEHNEGHPNELDSGDDARESSSDESADGEGDVPSQRRADAPAMDLDDLRTLVIGNDESSVAGLGPEFFRWTSIFPARKLLTRRSGDTPSPSHGSIG